MDNKPNSSQQPIPTNAQQQQQSPLFNNVQQQSSPISNAHQQQAHSLFTNAQRQQQQQVNINNPLLSNNAQVQQQFGNQGMFGFSNSNNAINIQPSSLFGNSNAYQQQMTNSSPNVQQQIPINNLSNVAPHQQIQFSHPQYPVQMFPPQQQQYGNVGLFGFGFPQQQP